MRNLVEVAQQFATRPSLREVADRMVRDALAQRYPDLSVDPSVAVIAPVAEPGGESSVPAVTLTDALLSSFADQVSPGWVAGRVALYFDSRLTQAEPADADVAQLSADIERLSFGLLGEFAQAVADYWSAPGSTHESRWQWLAERLRQNLAQDLRSSLNDGLNAASRDVLNTLCMFAGKPQRDFMLSLTPPGPDRLRMAAGIIHLRISVSNTTTSLAFPAIVIDHSQGERSQVTSWQPNGDIHHAPGLEDLVTAICAELAGQWTFDLCEWTFHESAGDIFHALGEAILARQLADVLAAQGALGYSLAELQQYLLAATDVVTWLQPSTMKAHLDPTRLPAWLHLAPIADKLAFCRALDALAAGQSKAGGRSFDDGLPPIADFAAQALSREMLRDHPDGPRPLVADIEILIDKVTGVAVASGGQMVLSGTVEPVSMSFVQFALDNLCSLPVGKVSVRHARGGELPAWLTTDYARELVTRVDIGGTYTQRIRHYLIDDPVESVRRRALFTDQLRLQLPLKALEQKLKGEGAMSTQGCALIAALMSETVAGRRLRGESIVLRPLAFERAPGLRADRVGNMFVIGPLDIRSGPHVLLRPFSAIPMTEFAEWSALLEAIVHPGELQNEVLAWLADDARAVYANGGFLEPHIVRFGQGSDFAPLERPAPARLATAACDAEPLDAMFDANALALVTLADRNSVSNAESRWAIFKEGGWVMLNALLPLVGGPIANAAWLAQLLVNFERVLALPPDVDARSRSETLAELLLNISVVLLHQKVSLHALAYRQFRVPRLAAGAARDPVGINEVSVDQARPLLDFSWSDPANQLNDSQRSALRAFRVTPLPEPGALIAQEAEAGVQKSRGQRFIRLGADVYRVERDDDGYYIVDPGDVERSGPRVSHDGSVWRLDLRLKLRGGGPKKRARELAEQNALTLARVRESRSTLARRRDELYRKMDLYNAQLATANEEVRALFLSRYDSELKQALDVVRQRGALVLDLRPGDRPGEHELGTEIKGLASRVRYFEGLVFKDIADITRASMLTMRRELTGDAVVAENVDAYLELFNKVVSRQETGVQWATVRESLWQQLRELPKTGDASWREEVLEFESTRLPSLLEWKIMRLFSVLELVFSREDILRPELYQPLKDLRLDAKLYNAMSSHVQLERPNDYSLSDRTEVLESALREYDRAIEIATFTRESDFQGRGSDYLDRFISQFHLIREAAEGQLTALIQENTDPPAKPVERVPRREQPRKKVIRTRDRQVLVGEIRGEPDQTADQVVDVRDVLTHRVINSWHRHADGGWAEVETETPSEPARPAASTTAALFERRRRASELLGQVDHAIASAWRQSTRLVEPEDMEDILTQRATRLAGLADSLNSTEDGALVADLRQAASRLIEEGRSLRIAMIKRQPPTAARVSYLHRQGQIDIARVDHRINLSGARRDDFLQEYSIRDKQHQLLWWAHFHYASEDADPGAFTAAHLKLPEQRKLGYKALVRAAQDSKTVVAIYRSAIGQDIAQRLFLALPG